MRLEIEDPTESECHSHLPLIERKLTLAGISCKYLPEPPSVVDLREKRSAEDERYAFPIIQDGSAILILSTDDDKFYQLLELPHHVYDAQKAHVEGFARPGKNGTYRVRHKA